MSDPSGRSQLTLLRQYDIRPVKRRGQNFLVDGNLARAIAQDVLALGDQVLELGAGAGALTTHLLPRAHRLVCVEVDRKLCALLRTEFGDNPAFTLVEGDLARLDWEGTAALAGPRPVVAGNLPYVLTSTVLFALADLRARTAGGIFMVQKEVADRLAAAPGGKDFGVLAVVMGSVFAIKVLRQVPASVFWPQPEVASAVIRLVPKDPWDEREYVRFVRTVRLMFSQRRKKLRSLLRTGFGYDAAAADRVAVAAGVDAGLRPEQLTVEDFRRLAAVLPFEGDA